MFLRSVKICKEKSSKITLNIKLDNSYRQLSCDMELLLSLMAVDCAPTHQTQFTRGA